MRWGEKKGAVFEQEYEEYKKTDCAVWKHVAFSSTVVPPFPSWCLALSDYNSDSF